MGGVYFAFVVTVGHTEQTESLLIDLENNRRESRMTVNKKSLFKSLQSYPSSVFYILGNEFCERFSFYGMKAILTLYLINEHHYKEK